MYIVWSFLGFKLYSPFILRQIASGLDIAEDLSRVSLLRYTADSQFTIHFNSFPDDKLALMQAIENAPYDSETSEAGTALGFANNQPLRVTNGWRENNQAPTAVIIVTDSINQEPATVVANSRYIHCKKAVILETWMNNIDR